MLKFAKKCVYYMSLIGPIYSFIKDICVNGYAIYINHLQEIETAKMRGRFNSDSLENISYEEFCKIRNNINKGE